MDVRFSESQRSRHLKKTNKLETSSGREITGTKVRIALKRKTQREHTSDVWSR